MGAVQDGHALLSSEDAHFFAGKYLLASVSRTSSRTWADPMAAPGNEVVRLRGVRIHDESGNTTESVDIRERVGFEMVFDVLQDGHVLVPSFHVFSEAGTCLFATLEVAPQWRGRARPRGRFTSVAWIPGNFFAEGALGPVSFTGRGECRMAKKDFPEPGLSVFRCFLEIQNLPEDYVGGQLTTNTVVSRRSIGEVSDPTGYIQPSIATIRLWKKRKSVGN